VSVSEQAAVQQLVQSPLTLVMKAESPAAFSALRKTVEDLQALPANKNPVIAALNRLGTVHFARFVFLGDDQLAVITTYDGDFDTYINDFIDEIGDVFNALLEHVDATLVPVQSHRAAFLKFVRDHDLHCVGPFYSAYPQRTVLDIVDTPSLVG
jgi:hypothetical protein